MASEKILEELFKVAKQSVLFKGMSEKNIWEACLDHKDNPDEEVRNAINNIHRKDKEADEQSKEQQAKLEQNKEKMTSLYTQELADRQQDQENADKILEELFNL